MNNRRWFSILFLSAALLLLGGYSYVVNAQKAAKEPKAITENRELDRQWFEAYQQKDLDKLMSLYWNSPELVSISPDGSVAKGYDNVRKGFEQFFSMAEAIRGEFTDQNYLLSGKDVVGFGSAKVSVKLKGEPAQEITIRYTDFRQKKDGKWVYVHDHAQAVLPPPGPKPTDSLYKRLGGYDAIAAVGDEFLARLMADPQLKRFFSGVSTDSGVRIRQLAVDMLCQATGGPCYYIGRDMKKVHAGLGISESDWQKMAGHLVGALDKFKVPEREKSELLSALGPLKKDIVEK